GEWVAADFAELCEQTNRLNDFFFLERHHATGPGYCCSGCRCTPTPANCGYAPDRSLARRTATSTGGSFSCSNQLQQLLGIVQPLLELWSKALRGDLSRDRDFIRGRISRDKLNFVDTDR